MIAGLILAGGKATRLGGADKALLPPCRPPPARSPACPPGARRPAPIALSANGDPARFAAWSLPVLQDTSADGPLSGLAAGLAWAEAIGADTLLSVPVDTPFIPTDLAARLAPSPSCAHSARTHHLVALWPVPATRAALTRLLAAPGSRAAARLAAQLATRLVAFPATPDPFLNLNTPADLQAAERRLTAS